MFVAVEYKNVVYKVSLFFLYKHNKKSLLKIYNFGITSLEVAEKPINVNSLYKINI